MNDLKNLNDWRWWSDQYETDDKRHGIVVEVAKRIQSQQESRQDNLLSYARLYGGAPLMGFGLKAYTRVERMANVRLSLNVIRNCCGAVTARITKSKPKPMFLTSGGDWKLQKKARQLTKFIEGQFYESKLYDLAPQLFLDACIFGTGIGKVYWDGSDQENPQIQVDRVFPWELFVDDLEAQYGTPRSLYHRRTIDRLTLISHYPDFEDKLTDTNRADADDGGDRVEGTADQVEVWEVWHLPSGKKAGDGRHVLCVQNCTLVDEEYTRDYFPFAYIRWSEPIMGYWGGSLVEELQGIQLEINTLLRKIQKSHHLLGAAHWIADNGGKVVSQQLDNEIGSIIRVSGGAAAAQVYTPQPIHPDTYQYLWSLEGKAYETSGISQLAASSQVPAHMKSGKAIDTFNDMQTERFIVVAREYEAFFLEVSRQMLDIARDIASKNGGYKVRTPGKNIMKVIAWKDVDMQADEYVMNVFPTSQLASSPSARMEQVQELAGNGWISPSEARRLIDLPDLEHDADRRFASHDLIEDLIEAMTDEGEYQPPEPYMDLQDAIQTTQNAYLEARKNKVPEERLELLRRFIQEAHDLAQPPPPPAPPPGPAGPAGPPGPPGPPMPGSEPMPPPMGGEPPPGGAVQ